MSYSSGPPDTFVLDVALIFNRGVQVPSCENQSHFFTLADLPQQDDSSKSQLGMPTITVSKKN